MRILSATVALSLAAAAAAQCPYYSNGTISAGLSRFNGGEDMRLVYVDCLGSIGLVQAKFGTTNGSTNLNGLPLTLLVYDDPTDDHDPHDAVLVAQVAITGGITGGNTGQWQTYDLKTLLGNPVAATGGMFVGLSVTYPAGTSPGPGSIEFGNNIAPGTQWLATDNGTGINYSNLGASSLVDIQTGPGFPPGTWVMRIESGAEYRTFGAGCTGSAGLPTLAGGAVLPSLGQIALFDATNLPGLADLIVLGESTIAPAIDLGTVFGSAPVGCTLAVSPIVVLTLPTVAGAAQQAISIPNTANLVGYSVLAQTVSIDPPANAIGWTSSNGVRAVIGW